MTDVYVYADVERLVVDTLNDLLPDSEVPTATAGVNVPKTWTPTDPPHVQVRVDVSEADVMPVAVRTTVALIARASTPTIAKQVTSVASALLVSRFDLISAFALTGPIGARDPDTNAELATTTLEVLARST